MVKKKGNSKNEIKEKKPISKVNKKDDEIISNIETKIDDDKKIESRIKKTKIDYFNTKNILLILIPLFLILTAMFYTWEFRTGTIELDGLYNNIEANTYSQIQSFIAQQIDMQYPNLNPQNRQNLIAQEMEKVYLSGEFQIGPNETMSIKDMARDSFNNFKPYFQGENNQTYLLGIDPYYFLYQANNYYFNGFTGNTYKEIDGEKVPWLDHRVSPNGMPALTNPEMHIWLMAKLFAFNGIDENSTISEKIKAVYLLPVIISLLAIIPIFLILKKFTNNIFAFSGAMILTSIGTYISRSSAGFVDTDAYIILFSLLIISAILYSFYYKDTKKIVLFSILAGIFTSLGFWAWQSIWFVPLFLIISIISYLFYLILISLLEHKNLSEVKNSSKHIVLILISYIFSSWIFVWIFLKMDIFLVSYELLSMALLGIANISQTYIWPNVQTTIAELNPASFLQIIYTVGGKFFFFFAFFGMVLMLLDFKKKNNISKLSSIGVIFISLIWFISIIAYDAFSNLLANYSFIFLILLFLPIAFALLINIFEKNKDPKIFFVIFLSIWMAATIYMSLNGVRFILLLAPGFAIASAIGLYQLAKILNNFISEEFKIKKDFFKTFYGNTFIFLIFLLFFVLVPVDLRIDSNQQSLFGQAQLLSQGSLPNFDDAWFLAFDKLNNQSNENAIITSWWDFGHFFIAVGNRGTTFDGGSQTTPASHWVGKLLLENDEKKALDILNMLVCGNNLAHNTMLSYTNSNNSDAIKINKILYETFGKNEEETRNIIKNNKYYEFEEEEINNIMQYLYCDEREHYLVTSGDMVGKAPVWAHWGLWNFNKKYVHDNYKIKTAQEISQEIDENLSLIESYINELNSIDSQVRANRNLKRADLVNRWFSPYPGYQGNIACELDGNESIICKTRVNPQTNLFGSLLTEKDIPKICKQDMSGIFCDIEIKMNFSDRRAFVSNIENPYELNTILIGQNLELERINNNTNSELDIVILNEGQNLVGMISQSPLGASLFTKLFYLDGFGTKHFELFEEQTSVTGQKIQIWKINYELEENSNFDQINLDEDSILENFNLDNSSLELNLSEEEILKILKEQLGEDFEFQN